MFLVTTAKSANKNGKMTHQSEVHARVCVRGGGGGGRKGRGVGVGGEEGEGSYSYFARPGPASYFHLKIELK